MVVFEGTVAAFALALAVGVFIMVARSGALRLETLLTATLGILAVLLDVFEIRQAAAGLGNGFLSHLLFSLPDVAGECRDARHSVFLARMVGEPAGIAVGVAMTALAGFAAQPGAPELARRSRWLTRLLYTASALFVAGIMMSRANFVWILTHWVPVDDKLTAAIDAVVSAGVLQSGVVYSALHAVFFAPARGLLSYQIHNAIPPAEAASAENRDAWLKKNELQSRWQDDVRQILAILAPVLSAPVFDAIVKL
jgi:hypothetical protein